jgi:predicted nicotinamide N-methyase
MTPDAALFVRRETRVAAPSLVPELRLHLADAALPLWQATEAEMAAVGLPPPYWAFAWPGGQALARLLLDRPELARGKRVVDFGAGCGIAAIAAARAGAAHVVAVDIDQFACAAIGLNAVLNDVAVGIDMSDPLAEPVAADLLLVGDMCYEKPLALRVEAWARRAAATGATVLLADPGRAYRPASGLVEVARCMVPTSLDLEDRTSRETIIWQVAPSV